MIKYYIFILLLVILYEVTQFNKKFNIKNESAKNNEYSDDNLYINISPLKHDIFKQFILDLFPLLLFYFYSNKNLELLNINNLEDFYDSIIGKFIISTLSFIIYYHIIQPYIINNINNL